MPNLKAFTKKNPSSEVFLKCTLNRLALPLLLVLATVPALAQQKLTRHVDPFIGTDGPGHTFPGATLPFGMVQLSPDTRLTGWEGCSGYHYSDNIIYGFSHTHLSGTGISDYGDILFMPTAGPLYLNALAGDDPTGGYASRFSHRNETARPGYYSVRLDDENIFVELTATKRVGLHRYIYPANQSANLILDLTHRDKVLDSYLRIVDGTRLEGYRRSEGWARNQIVYFAAEFSEPFISSGIALDDKLSEGLKEARGLNVKSFYRFRPGASIMLKVAISAVSTEGARKNLAAELDHWDFDRVKAEADIAWERELNKIQVTGGSAGQLKTFYTALYHALIAPNLFMDVDGQYLGRDFQIHKAQGFTNYTVFSLWDTFRATHPLYTIIDQKRTVDFIDTFLVQYEQGGRLPVWELAANETDTMIGYHAVPVIADAAVKGIKGFDLEKAFAAMKHSANLKHFGLEHYVTRGYISLEDERESVSKTLEYAYDDWCIAMVARLLGREEDYRDCLRRAQYYKNVFDSETGFMRPRHNGGWLTPFDPREVDFNFTEANSWQYSFFVPQDISGLIQLLGGKEKFARKLDDLFNAESETTGRHQADITGLIGQYAHGNEPSHHMAYLYNYVGQPWKTQERVRQIMDQFYLPEPDGLIGNEDCGQLSAWYVLSAAGFYPVTPGSTIYAIGTPLFPGLKFNLENGRTFTIRARQTAPRNIYIQSASLNGKPYRKSYLLHEDLMKGGELVFVMGSRPNPDWGSKDTDIPVSRIDEHLILPVPVISAAGRVFRRDLEISMSGVGQVHYTQDNSEPDQKSPVYVRPFVIDRSTVVKAIAIAGIDQKSFVVTAGYHKIPHDWTVTVVSKRSPQYQGGGDLGLIDGIRGNDNFSTGAWQGYQGQDFEALVDLGAAHEVRRLGAGFLQDIRSWIWAPRRVEFEVSLDGQEFDRVLSLKNDVPDRDYGVILKDLVGDIPVQSARYVRVRAIGYGKIPEWHPGHGGASWIFVDEIIIE